MAIFTVGPNSTYASIAAAMAAAGPGDTIQLEAGYSNETATVTHSGMIITGEASSLGIVLELGSGIATVTLAGSAPINLIDAPDGNGIVGNDGANLITVTAGADAASGGPGDDRLFVDYRLATGAVTGDSTSNVAEAGGGGRLVTINGGFEHFTIWTGSGADTITTGAGDDDIRTGEGAGTVTAGEGANHIIGGSGADTITAGSGGNFVDGGDGANTITTGGGIDEILTGRDMDTIVAGAGNDRITILGGADTVDGGAGSDHLVVDYSAAVTAVTGGVTGGDLAGGYTGHLADLAGATVDFVGTERFSITTGTGNDVIATGGADDMIATGAGDDMLAGGGGNDTLDGGAGEDQMHGGAGHDLYIVDNANDVVTENVGEGTDTVRTALAAYSLEAVPEVEHLYGGGNDQVLTGNNGANLIHGAGGIDTLIGLAGDDIYYTDVSGTQVVEAAAGGFDAVYTSVNYMLDADSEIELLSVNSHAATSAIDLTGNSFNQTLIGNAGANILDGGGGIDTLIGLGGDDIYYTDAAATRVIEAAGGGADQLYTSVSYTLDGNAEIETLSANGRSGTSAINLGGNHLDNLLEGNDGANVLHGGGGNDVLIGFGGNDVYYTDVAATQVLEAAGGGSDALYTSVSYTLAAGSEIELLSVNSHVATTSIALAGNEISNTIVGNAGANLLDGGGGNDVLVGLGGADSFAFTTGLGAGNVDRIADYQSGLDRILLDDAVFTGLGLGALSAGAFANGAAADADDRIVYDQSTGGLYYDADGNGAGAAVLFATLDGAPILSASDFFVI
jgi:serralysin